MKKFYFLIFLMAVVSTGWSQILLVDDFTGLTTGSTLVGQSGWTKGGSGPELTVQNTSALTYTGYNGGGGEYASIPTAIATASRVYKALTSTPAPATNTFYYSLLINLSGASATGDYFISLGDPGTNSNYFARLFAKASGSGYVLGGAKFSNVASATFGSTVLSFNQTYLVVVKYTFVTSTANDEMYLWVNPSLASEPLVSNAEATVLTTGSDPTLASVGNFHWHNRTANNPAGSFDAVRVAYGATSADAWTNLAAAGTVVIPVPTTTSVSPATATAGGPSYTITVNGTNFISGQSTVTWNGTPLATTFVSATQLTAVVPSALIATAGTATVGVSTTGAASVSNTQTVTISTVAASVTAGTVNDFGSVTVGTNSTAQSFNISGTNLTGAPGVLTVTAPTDFQVSNNNSTWGSTTTIAYSSATLASTPVWVRFTPATAGAKTGNVSITGGGLAAAVNVAVSGTGLALQPPVAPVATAATNLTSTGFTANWNAVAGATNYFLDVYTLNTTTGTVDVAGWNMATNTASNTTADVGNANNIGIQTLTLNGSTGTISYPGGPSGTSGTPNPYSVSATGWDNGADAKFWQINVNTTGATGLTLSSLQGSSSTGPANFKVQYKVGAAGTWTDIPGATVAITTAVSPGNLATWGTLANLPVPAAAENQPIVSFRWIMTNNLTLNGSLVGSGGTSRISAIYIKSASGTTQVPVYVPGYQNLSVGNVTSNNVTGLASSTTYYYVVRAENGGGVSPNSNAITATTQASIIPTITAGTLASFGNVCLNANGANSFTLNGTNLTTADIVVGPLAGYSFSTTSGGTYTSTLTIPQTGGSFSGTVQVRFTPTAVQSYNGNIPVTGGGTTTTVNVAATGSGVNTQATVATGSASNVSNVAATASGTISAQGCSNVSAYGIEYSTTNNFPAGTGTQVAGSNLTGTSFGVNLTGLTANTPYYYRAYATNAGGTSYGSLQSFTTLATPPATLTTTTLAPFGSVCVNTSVAPASFTISGSNLTNAAVTVGPLAGYSFSTTVNGTYTPSLSLTQGGGTFTQQVFVQFNPTAAQSYNGNISVSGGGAAATVNVAAAGTGVNTPATVTTGSSSIVSNNVAEAAGTINTTGCGIITAYGIEYSAISGFAGGTGTKLNGSNLAANNFSVQIQGLVPGTTYYYRAFATNSSGTGYGAIASFIMPALPNGFAVYPVPATAGSYIQFSKTGLQPGYYGLILYNNAGQQVLNKGYNIQVDFINDRLMIPASLPAGIYLLRLFSTTEALETKTILVR